MNVRVGTVIALPVLLVLLGGLGVRGCVNRYEAGSAGIEVRGRELDTPEAATKQARSDARGECRREPSWISRLLGFSPPAEVVIYARRNPQPFRLATVNCKTNVVIFGGRA